MAPEFTPNIALLDLRIDESGLKGTLRYYEKSDGKITVRWLIDEPPDGYREIGEGAAYIKDEPSIIEPPPSENKRLLPISADRYQWAEAARFEGKPPPMLILILPRNYTAVDLLPKPIGTDIFTDGSGDKRLVLFWMPEDEEAKRMAVEWTLKPTRQAYLESERTKINSRYLSLRATDEKSSSSLVETQSIGDQNSRIRLLNNLYRAFTIDGLNEICFILAVDYEDLPGETKNPKILGLIRYFNERDRIAELIRVIEQLRPSTPWRTYFADAGYRLEEGSTAL